MVLRPAYGTNLTVVLPVDSGSYRMYCPAEPSARSNVVNCSAWHNYTAGSMDHFDHTALANLHFWGGHPEVTKITPAALLAAQFKNMFWPLGSPPALRPEPTEDLMMYMEVMVVGNIPFAEGISHVILYFSALFGTPRGRQVVEWAAARGIGVAWSSGEDPANTGNAITAPYPWPTSQLLLLDPTVPFAANATADRAAFDACWTRVANKAPGAPDAWWAAEWNHVYGLVGRGMHLHNLRPGLCADTEGCIGVDDDSHCICGRGATANERAMPTR